MKTLKVSVEVDIYEIDGREVKGYIMVHSHWNQDTKVILEINGKKYTVLAGEFKKAIENTTNTRVV